MNNNAFYVIGQLLGIIAVILGFISFQMKTQKGIIVFQLITAFVFCIHYFMIGAMMAMALNIQGAIQCIFYYFRNKRGSKSTVEPAFFTILVIVTSILTWEGWYSAFIMTGLVVNTISLAFTNPQKTRAAMLIKSPLCLLYNAIVHSVGGIIFECAVLLSAILGMIKNREKD